MFISSATKPGRGDYDCHGVRLSFAVYDNCALIFMCKTISFRCLHYTQGYLRRCPKSFHANVRETRYASPLHTGAYIPCTIELLTPIMT